MEKQKLLENCAAEKGLYSIYIIIYTEGVNKGIIMLFFFYGLFWCQVLEKRNNHDDSSPAKKAMFICS